MSEDLPFKECGNIVLGPSYIKRWSYAVSKLYCENLVFAYHQEYGLPVVVLRYFGCFGSRSNSGPSGGHIPLFISEAMRGGVLTIHGNGRQTRSMGYVGDVVRGTILAIKNKKAVGEILNIGNDEEMSVLEAAEYIIKISGNKKARLEFIPHKKVFGEYKEIMRRIPDLTKAKKILGYSPSVSIREALKIVYEDSRSKK
jgi:UDP-glucose 4-epimerase